MQLLSKLENISMSAAAGAIPMTQETSLFAELEVLSHSMSVDSFDNRPAQKITIGTQVIVISINVLLLYILYSFWIFL